MNLFDNTKTLVELAAKEILASKGVVASKKLTDITVVLTGSEDFRVMRNQKMIPVNFFDQDGARFCVLINN